jgi:hypothetical protein
MLISRWKHPTLKSHLLGIVQGFSTLADGIVTVCSLGFFYSDFEMRLACFIAHSTMQGRKKKSQNNT